jgi:hypothetical protein
LARTSGASVGSVARRGSPRAGDALGVSLAATRWTTSTSRSGVVLASSAI